MNIEEARPLVEALAAYPCPNQTGRYLPTCQSPECSTNKEGHRHQHFGDIRDCGKCPPCRAKLLVAIKSNYKAGYRT